MKIIITGASGLIGKRLCKVLKQDGFDIEFLKRHDYNNTIEEKDWLSRKNIFWSNPEILENADAVVHLAGANVGSSWTRKYKKEILNSRKLGTEALMKACADCQTPPKHIISASGIGFYHENTNQLLNETSESGNTFLAEVCKIWEQGIFEHKIPGAVASCLRTGIVISNHSKVFGVSKLQFQLFGMVGSVGSPNNLWSWIHIDDLVRLFMFILEFKLEGVYNAVAPNPVQQIELTKLIAKILQRPLVLPNVPELALRLILGEMGAIALESQRVCAAKIQDAGFKFNYLELEPALEDLIA